jgi:hypothetical protein
MRLTLTLSRFYSLIILFSIAGCGGGGNSDASPLGPDRATQIAAAQQTAASNASCQAITPFYLEIGDRNGAITNASIGGTTYVASTPMNVASASKWLFGAYVAEVRNGMLSATDVQATHMQSGYVSMGNACGFVSTVSSCFNAGANNTHTPASVGLFHYDSGHFQKWGVDNGLATMTGAQVAAEYRAVLGNDIGVAFNSILGPLLAGGAVTSADSYAVFLKKILNSQLKIADLLGYQKTCTLPGTCATAQFSPVTAAWSYSVGHWVEDDATGDGAFSSAGAFGFYPWIDKTKTYYGIIAREDTGGGAAQASIECGLLVRKAFIAGIAQ